MRQSAPLRHATSALRAGVLCFGLWWGHAWVWAQTLAQANPWSEVVQQLAQEGARQGMPGSVRVVVEVGALDPRLKLAPCQRVQPYLPAGLRMWGRTRVGLRCVEGPSRWNVSLPVLVKVFAQAPVVKMSLPVGAVLTQSQLQMAEIDMAAEAGQVFLEASMLEGRTLAKPLGAGEAVRSTSLKARQWFAAGDIVQVVASGQGYAVASEGQALNVGMEGQDVRVRFENGRTVVGRAVSERRVEVPL